MKMQDKTMNVCPFLHSSCSFFFFFIVLFFINSSAPFSFADCPL